MREQNAAGRTIVSFLLDRTGWMDPVKVETVNAVNAFLQMLETEAGDLVEFTMLQYNSLSTHTLCLGAKLADVPRLTP